MEVDGQPMGTARVEDRATNNILLFSFTRHGQNGSSRTPLRMQRRSVFEESNLIYGSMLRQVEAAHPGSKEQDAKDVIEELQNLLSWDQRWLLYLIHRWIEAKG